MATKAEVQEMYLYLRGSASLSDVLVSVRSRVGSRDYTLILVVLNVP